MVSSVSWAMRELFLARSADAVLRFLTYARHYKGFCAPCQSPGRQQGKVPAAPELSAGICGWFTEGFDAPDLQEARVLLEEFA